MPITVALLGDSHWNRHSRWDECQYLHDWTARDVADRGVDLVCHAGDVFHVASTPIERNRVAQWVCSVAETAPMVFVRGNHDVVGDLAYLSMLRTRHPVVVEEACGVHRIRVGDVEVGIAALAWPRKAELIARLDRGGAGSASIEATGEAARAALRHVLMGMSMGLAEVGGPRLLLAHAMVRGSVTSLGQPLVGCDMEVALEDLALCAADFIGLGHIHNPQAWTWTRDDEHETPIVYTGSPRRTAFGELEEKSYVLATFEQGQGRGGRTWRLSDWERVPVPARKMILLNDEWGPLGEAQGWCGESFADVMAGDVADAEVRLRYTAMPDQRAAAGRAADEVANRLRARGAERVVVEALVKPVAKARAPEVAKAVTLEEKLRATWRARCVALSPEREGRLVARLHDLEREVTDAQR